MLIFFVHQEVLHFGVMNIKRMSFFYRKSNFKVHQLYDGGIVIVFAASSQQMGRQSMSRRQRRQRQQSHMMEMVHCSLNERAEHPNQDEIIGNSQSDIDDPQLVQKSELPKINITKDLDEVFQVPKQSDITTTKSVIAPEADNKTKTTETESKPNDPSFQTGESQLGNKASSDNKSTPLNSIPASTPTVAETAAASVFEEQSKMNLAKMGKHVSLDESRSAVPLEEDLASKVCTARSQLKPAKWVCLIFIVPAIIN